MLPTDSSCPCRNCVAPKRHIGCHSDCEEYLEWFKKNKAKQKMIRDSKYEENDFVEYRKASKLKYYKRHGR